MENTANSSAQSTLKNEDGAPVLSIEPAYRTELGTMLQTTVEAALDSNELRNITGQVQLIFTSPPFILLNEKRYGNERGIEYVDWLSSFADSFRNMLREDGSIVIELGNAWEPGRPIMSTLVYKALLAFLEQGRFSLCQTFVAHNPARLPGPASWVTVRRLRAKDSYTNIWWLGKNDFPKSDNRRVLQPYSSSMRKLLERKSYNAGRRPSEHNINSRSFLADNGGAIPSNVLTFANTGSSDPYQKYCRTMGIRPHPARMARGIAEFFINFLTDPLDLIMDPFAGSNTTGAVAESLGRRWISIDPEEDYVLGSIGRFRSDSITQVTAVQQRE